MKALFLNIPFVKRDEKGNIFTGPNAGSRWPWTAPGITVYAPFPFFMAYAVSYLRESGIDATFYDAVAEKHWDDDLIKQNVSRRRPEVLFIEVSTPLARKASQFAQWAKTDLGSRVVMVGPHVQAYANDLSKDPFVDHCVVGEYELPALDIVLRGAHAKPIYSFDHLQDINQINGRNFVPYRDFDVLHNYWEPTMNTPRPQLTVSTSRGCPFKCTYCQWPKVMNNGQYRNRAPEFVIDEIRSVLELYKRRQASPTSVVNNARINFGNLRQRRMSPMTAVSNALIGGAGEIRSILFDDDTWNLGTSRIKELCKGLKDVGLPWTMMGRIDTSSLDLYDLMVESGCVGMRFGIESFTQRLLDNTKKHLDAKKSYDNIRYLLSRFSNMEFHFTTMKNLPGEKAEDWENDLKLLNELKALGEKSGNRVHWQNSDCIAFPGTELWDEMVAMGKGDDLRNFDLYDGSPHNDATLATAVGWLGTDYTPKWSKYSKMGEPTNMPSGQ
jgi:radical SAM superfamily enzyme YgiQ (UPF0313 family)